MKRGVVFVLGLFLISIILPACGPSQAEMDATTTQLAANIFATQTASAPTITPTFTPSPTATLTPTPTRTNTPKPTLTPTPGLESVGLKISDLPRGFEIVPMTDMEDMLNDLPGGARVFGFKNDTRYQMVTGLLLPYSKAERTSFDLMLPDLVKLYAQASGGDTNIRKITGINDLGESRAGVTSTGKFGSLKLSIDVIGFRRGEVGVLLILAYPTDDPLEKSIRDLANIMDERIINYLAGNAGSSL